MAKIAIIIDLPKKLNSKILFMKKEIKKKFGNQIYLSHPPHITLYTCDIKNMSIFKRSLQALNKKIKINCSINIKTKKFNFFREDPLTNGNTFYLSVEPNKELIKIQKKIFTELNINFKIKTKYLNSLKVDILKKNYLNYGYPFFGSIWKPHITIASINKRHNIDNLENIFALNPNNIFSLKEITIYKIVNNFHEKVDIIKLNEKN